MLVLLVACAGGGGPSGFEAPMEERAPPPPVLAVDPLVAGASSTFHVAGVAPGSNLRFAISEVGAGAGRCLPAKPTCSGLLDPVHDVGEAVADIAGEASLPVDVEVLAPERIWVQAFAGSSGIVVASNVVEAAIAPAACGLLDEATCATRPDCWSNYGTWRSCTPVAENRFAACMPMPLPLCEDVVTPAYPPGRPDMCFTFGSAGACIPAGWHIGNGDYCAGDDCPGDTG